MRDTLVSNLSFISTVEGQNVQILGLVTEGELEEEDCFYH